MSEVGGLPRSTMLYKLPIDQNEGIEIPASTNYFWSGDSKYFTTQRILEQFIADGDQTLKSEILIYNLEGVIVKTIRYGTSMRIFSRNFMIYMNEFDKAGNWISPRLMKYDIKSDTSTIYYEFGDSLTFWSELVDCASPPKLVDAHYGGLRGLIFKKGNPQIYYTFVVHNKKGLIFWIKGNYTNIDDLPEEGIVYKE